MRRRGVGCVWGAVGASVAEAACTVLSTVALGNLIVIVDLAGFTALTKAHGDVQAADLATAFCTRMREIAPRFDAEVIKSIGDAVMLRCESADAALDLALEILDREDARSGFPGVRMGMHSGAATERKGDWFGASVNVAARVSALAAGGEIVLTDEPSQAPRASTMSSWSDSARGTSGTSRTR